MENYCSILFNHAYAYDPVIKCADPGGFVVWLRPWSVQYSLYIESGRMALASQNRSCYSTSLFWDFVYRSDEVYRFFLLEKRSFVCVNLYVFVLLQLCFGQDPP